MYKKNTEALEKTNPELVKKLNEVDLEKIKPLFAAYSLRNGEIVLTFNSQPLDDIYAPMENAKSIWQSMVKSPLSKNDFVFVFGLGLGYLFKRATVETNAKIIVYEPHIEILRYVLEYTDISAELAQERILLTNSYEKCSEIIRKKYITNDKLEIIFNQQYLQMDSANLQEFTKMILATCQNKLADIETGFRYRSSWIENIIRNVFSKDDYYPLNFIKDKFKGKTALIAAAGPSLKKNIELIKANRDKFVIIAVNKIYEYLVQNGINPEFTVFVDAESTSLSFKNGEPEFMDTNIIMSLKTDHYCSSLNSRNKFLIFNDDQSILAYLKDKAPDLIEFVEFSGTTSGVAFFAAQLLGFRKIIFGGLDLAFKEGEYYASNDQQPNVSNGVVIVNDNSQKKIVEIESFKNEKIKSREDYSLFINELGEIFSAQKEHEIYNTTDFGAKIKGMIYEPMETLVQKLDECTDDTSLSELTGDDLRKKQKEFNDFIRKTILNLINQCSELKEQFLNVTKPNSEMLKYVTQNPLLFTLLEKDILYLLGLTKQVVNMAEFTSEFQKLCQRVVKEIEFIEYLKQYVK